MKDEGKKAAKKRENLEQKVGELLLDLQRTRADFENYRKRAESEKAMARASGKVATISQLLPIIDTIERAIGHTPAELKDNAWAAGITGLLKKLDKMLIDLNVRRINAAAGVAFNPELHNAVQFDEAEGDHEVVTEELQAGYMLGDDVLRPSMVKVTRK
ncbi:MAG TPA: nucleotide exchange factor GrpE [Candidatus Saccharibacteria bacterium]|nr:nucleotide exchange factor GrpE [Candidatus Saccharibacteria bacterium]